MPKSKGVSAPFFFARFVPSRQVEALLAQATEDFTQGRFADALVSAESVCRMLPSEPAPAVLRAKVLHACRPTMSPRAWADAWSRDPLNPTLQDAMLAEWLRVGERRRVAEQGMTFLPHRCRQGTHAPLLRLLAQAGIDRAGACWRDGDAIEIRSFALNGEAAQVRVVVESGDERHIHELGTDAALRVDLEAARGVYSVAYENGRVLQGSPISFDEPAAASHKLAVEAGVQVIIPVYRGAPMVQACVRSVLGSLPHNSTPVHVTVVNDASPEPGLVLWLESLAAAGRIELVHNAFNLGFIESMNRALRTGRRDALMLNSDTLVHGDWVDRLVAALGAAPDIASVMPWSNNAEVGSLAPDRTKAPDDSDFARIDATASRLRSTGETADMEVPTTIGFAMLMRRSVIDAIGVLDGVALTRGYLEEVDWCLRARAAGFRHMLATGVFVAHKGSASFGPEKQLRVRQNRAVIAARYPRFRAEYLEYVRHDALREARRKLLDAIRAAGVTWPGSAKPAARIDPRAALAGDSRRIAVWGLRAGTNEETRVLELARRLASAGEPRPTRLLVFGEASEALRHTGVVDVIMRSRETDEALPDEVLASLAGCEELLLADPSVKAPEGIPAHAA